MNFYMGTGEYRHLKEECFGLVKTFYSEYDWSFAEEANDGHVIVAYRNDHFFVSIFNEEAEIQVIEGDYRNSVKKQLYQLLAKETGKKLPWGILQGIRPTKLVYKLFRGLGFEHIKDGYEQLVKKMTEDYLVSRPMAELAVDVALEEFDLIPSRPDDSIVSIYISIPFCPTRCHYCSFPSNPIRGWDDQLDDYVDGLIHEMEVLIPMILSRYTLSTVYVGGGTPTSLTPGQLDRLLKAVKSFVGEQPIRELTLEAGRPDTITEDKLKVLKENGVERISINPQTMNQRTLDCIGRAHQVDDIYRGVSLAEKVGLNRVNMDTIIGLPGEKESHVRHTFNELMKIRPTEVTVHTLAIKGLQLFMNDWTIIPCLTAKKPKTF